MQTKRLPPPEAPPPQRACEGCNAFAPDVAISTGSDTDSVALLCFVCAHFVGVHGAPVKDPPSVAAACKCTRHEIFPADVNALAERRKADRAFYFWSVAPVSRRIKREGPYPLAPDRDKAMEKLERLGFACTLDGGRV